MYLLDYLATEFAPFGEKPFNPVDSAALSQFCMVRLEGIAPELRDWEAATGLSGAVQRLLHPMRGVRFADALRAEKFEGMFTGLVPDRIKETLYALAASPRFRELRICDYASVFDVERQVQFAAMTFVRGKDFAYVAFRGTDTSFTGWRENFNMTYLSPVPAQELAAQYLEAVAPHLPKRLFVGGHSKGGNLAEYAALHASPAVQERIERVYDHDGPGFRAGTVSEADYATICGRVHKTVPQESIVGMLMDTPADLALRVVRSSERGILQHSPFTWEIDGTDFVYADKLADSALSIHAIVSHWLAGYTPEETQAVVEAASKAIASSRALDASEILSGGMRSVTLLVEAAKNLDPASRDVLVGAMGSLANLVARDATRNVASILPFKTKG